MEEKENIPQVCIPGSKSHTIRALIIAAAAHGRSRISNILVSADTASVMKALEALGVRFALDAAGNVLTVDSTHVGEGLSSATLDMGNSGTGTYLIMGLAASLGIPVTITGDESLRKRPIGKLCDAYRALGADISDSDGFPPFTICGPLEGGTVSVECPTSQYLSSLLLAAPLSRGKCTMDTPLLYEKPYVRMTLKYLDEQEIAYRISDDLEHSEICGNQGYRPMDMAVGGDWSSACFFMALAAIHGRKIMLSGLDPHDTQGDMKVVDVLESMGCRSYWTRDGLVLQGPEKLRGGKFDLNDIPDSLPILAVVATQASEKVILHNVANARIKETDRIRAMHDELVKLGADVRELEDGLEIDPSRLKGTDVCGYDDHRIIMSLAVLDTALEEKLHLDNTEKVNVTFPTFFGKLGAVMREIGKR